MNYVIQRIDQGGGYVAKPGNHDSYTFNIRNMQKFSTREEAEAQRCPGNEVVVPIEYVMD